MTVKSSLKVSTISYAIVYVKDTAKSLAFYRDVLGCKVKVEAPGWVEFDLGPVTLALHGEEKARPIERGNNTLLVFPVPDVFEAHEALKASGVKIYEAPKMVCETPTGKGYSLDFADLDGNLLSFYSEKAN
jgi:lactoylglutathione lyase